MAKNYQEIMCDMLKNGQCTHMGDCVLKRQDGKCAPVVKADKAAEKAQGVPPPPNGNG